MAPLEAALSSSGKLSRVTVDSYVTKLEYAIAITRSKSFTAMASDPVGSYAKLRKHYTSDGTLKQTLTALLAALRATGASPKSARVSKWRALHAAVSKKAAAIHDGVATKSMVEKYVCWSKIMAAEQSARKRHDTLQESMDACLLALLTRLPPKRADFGELSTLR